MTRYFQFTVLVTAVLYTSFFSYHIFGNIFTLKTFLTYYLLQEQVELSTLKARFHTFTQWYMY